jgi:hypothetical protein
LQMARCARSTKTEVPLIAIGQTRKHTHTHTHIYIYIYIPTSNLKGLCDLAVRGPVGLGHVRDALVDESGKKRPAGPFLLEVARGGTELRKE